MASAVVSAASGERERADLQRAFDRDLVAQRGRYRASYRCDWLLEGLTHLLRISGRANIRRFFISETAAKHRGT